MNFAAARVEVRVYATTPRLDVTVSASSVATLALEGGLCGTWDTFYTTPNGTHVFGNSSASFAPSYGASCT